MIADAGGVTLVGSRAGHVCAEIDARAYPSSAFIGDGIGIAVIAGRAVRQGLVGAGAVAVADGGHLARVRCSARSRARMRREADGAAERSGIVRAASAPRASNDIGLVGLGSARVIRVLVCARVRIIDRLDVQIVVVRRELGIDRRRPLPIDGHPRRIGDEVRGPGHRIDPSRKACCERKRCPRQEGIARPLKWKSRPPGLRSCIERRGRNRGVRIDRDHRGRHGDCVRCAAGRKGDLRGGDVDGRPTRSDAADLEDAGEPDRPARGDGGPVEVRRVRDGSVSGGNSRRSGPARLESLESTFALARLREEYDAEDERVKPADHITCERCTHVQRDAGRPIHPSASLESRLSDEY